MGWRPWLLRSIAALSAFQIAAHFGHELTSDYLWDLRTYARALDSDNPYDPSQPLIFVYAPMVADVLRLAGTHLFEALLTAYAVATIWFVHEITQSPAQHPGRLFLMALSTAGMGTVSFMSGNLTAFLHFAVLATGLATLRLNLGTGPLLLALMCAAIVKPYFLALMLLAPLIGSSRRREWIKALGAAIGVVLVYAAYFAARRHEMDAFGNALSAQVLGHGDYGSSAAALVARYGGGAAASTAALAFTALLIAGWVIWFLRQLPVMRSPLALFAAYAALSLINPRVHVYDLFPIFFCLIAIVDQLGWPSITLLALFAASLAGSAPSLIREFARDPRNYSPVFLDYTVAQFIAIVFAVGATIIAIRQGASSLADAKTLEDVTQKIV